MDLSNICRTCIRSDSLYPIFLDICDHSRYSTAIYITTGLKVELDDGFPQSMCATCICLLNSYLRFRKQCRAAEKRLVDLKSKTDRTKYGLNQSGAKGYQETVNKCQVQIKIEIPSEDEDDEKLMLDVDDVLNGCDYDNSDEAKATDHGLDEDTSNILCMEELATCEQYQLKLPANVAWRHTDDKVKCQFCEDHIVTREMERHMAIHGLGGDFRDSSELVQNTQRPAEIQSGTGVKNESSGVDVHSVGEYWKPLMDIGADQKVYDLKNANKAVETKEIYFRAAKSSTGKSERVTCLLCQQELSIRSLDGHMARRHPGVDPRKVKCELCESYVLRSKMNRHRLMKHGNRGFGCGFCKLEFDNKESLLEHVPTCSAKKKKRKAPESSRKVLECDICHKSMQKGSLRLHKDVKHAGLGPVCQHCGKPFSNKFRLNEHYRAKHGYEKIKCSRCDFQSASTMAMRNHERRHLGEKPYVCDTCGAKFHAAYLLVQHKQSHRAEKLFKCEVCPASFKANNSLHMHRRTCHSTSLYSCTMCERTYSNRHYVVKHLRQVHQYRGPVPSLQQLPIQSDGA